MAHQHNHHHDHHHGHDFVEANKDHYNQHAHSFDSIPYAVERAERSALAMRNVYSFDKERTTVMEYACGTGLVCKEMAPHVKSIVGVDISQGVVDICNERFIKEGLPVENFYATQAELKGQEDELDGKKFDAIYCTSAYHHFPSVEETTRTLSFFLKPGGALLVIDNRPIDPKDFPEEYNHVVAHKHGFTEGDIQKLFGGAGLTDVTYTDVPSSKDGKDNELFLAKGIKPL
ncbi:S-adenosyl-L-methionine-dependent methyltransferase [Cyathus striatus]|nr:S-adenosyl-L-methionine-dependent methyltransferase [Cyathus striatus]